MEWSEPQPAAGNDWTVVLSDLRRSVSNLVLYVLESMPMPWIFPSLASSQGGGSGGGGGAGGGGGGGVGHFSKTDARPWDHEWMGLSELASSVAAAADGPAQPALSAAPPPPPPPSSLPHEKPKRMSKKKQVAAAAAAAAAAPPPPPPAPLSSPAHLIVPSF